MKQTKFNTQTKIFPSTLQFSRKKKSLPCYPI